MTGYVIRHEPTVRGAPSVKTSPAWFAGWEDDGTGRPIWTQVEAAAAVYASERVCRIERQRIVARMIAQAEIDVNVRAAPEQPEEEPEP